MKISTEVSRPPTTHKLRHMPQIKQYGTLLPNDIDFIKNIKKKKKLFSFKTFNVKLTVLRNVHFRNV